MIHHYRNLEWKKSFQLRSLDKVPESGMQKKKEKRERNEDLFIAPGVLE